MKNIAHYNQNFTKATINAKKVNEVRLENVNEAINFIMDNYKSSDFTNKKNFVSYFINNTLNIDSKETQIDAYTKRVIKVAKALICDGYKIKKELLTIAQMENLIAFNSQKVNNLMKADDYLMAVKELKETAKVEKKVKIFSKAKAKSL